MRPPSTIPATALPLQSARRRPAHHQFRRRQHLGQARGDRSADRRADPSPLGQGLRRRHRLDEARRLLDALSSTSSSASDRSIAGLRTRTRWSRSTIIAPSTSMRARLRSTPRCMVLFPRACRPRSRRRGDRDRGERKRRSAHARDLWRRARLPAVAAAGLRPRAQARRDGGSQSEHERRRARRPRAVHLGADLEGLLPNRRSR